MHMPNTCLFNPIAMSFDSNEYKAVLGERS